MSRLVLVSALILWSSMGFADVAKGLYLGTDGRGRPCQVEVLNYTESVDPSIALPVAFEDALLYSNVKRTMDLKLHFISDDVVTVDSTFADWQGEYTTYALEGKAGRSLEQEVHVKLGLGGDGLVEINVISPKLFGLRGSRIQSCLNLVRK